MAQWALDFDGTNDYVDCGAVATGSWTALTVECWVKFDALEDGGIVAQWGLAQVFKLEMSSSKVVWTVTDARSGVFSARSEDLSTEKWFHVAGTFDSSGVGLWIDGELVDSDTGSADALPANSQDVELGRLSTTYASMRLAWMRISDSVRYAAAFTAPKSPPWPDANTVLQYDFIEGTGTGLNNREGTATYDGTISGATWRWDAPDRIDLWGGSYERFGDEWTVLISGTDRTSVTALDSISILEEIGSNRDTAVFRLEDVAASVAPATWSHVQIWHGGSLLFGGYVVALDLLVKGIHLDVVCHCVDWTVLLDKRVVAESYSYTNENALTILKDITENGWVPEIDATLYTGTGTTGLDVDVNYGYVADLVKQLAERSGFYWFLREDEEGDVYLYFSDATRPAPFGLSTSPDMSTTLPLRVLQWSVSGSDRVNTVFVLVDDVYDRTYSNWEFGLLRLEGTLESTAAEHKLIGANVLDELDADRVTGRIELRYGGVHPGMTIGIVHGVLDVDDDFLVHQVRIKPEGGGAVRYELAVSNLKTPAPTLSSALRWVWKRL